LMVCLQMNDDEAEFRTNSVLEARITYGQEERTEEGDDDEDAEYEEILIPHAVYDDYTHSTVRPMLGDRIVDPVVDVVQTVHELHEQRQMDDDEHELRFGRRRPGRALPHRQSPQSFVSLGGLAPRSDSANDLQHIFVDVEGSVEDDGDGDEDGEERPPVLTPPLLHRMAPKRSFPGVDVGGSSVRRMRIVRPLPVQVDIDDGHSWTFVEESSDARHGTSQQQQLRPLVSTEQTDLRLVQNVRNKGGRPRSVRPRLIDDGTLFRCPSCMTVFQTDEACTIHQRAMHGVIYRSCY
jgi:hypothetical protein